MAREFGSGLDSQLHREARERALNVTMEAADRAAQIVREAEDAARDVVRRAVSQSETELETRVRQEAALATLAARRHTAQRRQEFLDALWARASEQLRGIVDQPLEDRLVVLTNLIVDAAAQMAGQSWEMVIDVAPHDRSLLTPEHLDALLPRLGEYGVARVTVSDASIAAAGGVVVHKLGSREAVVNTFDERLALARSVLRDRVERLLIPPEGNHSSSDA